MYLTDPDGYYICYGCDLITEHAGMAGRIQFDKHILTCVACKNINNGPKGQKLYYIAKIANYYDEENNKEYINKANALIKDGANVDLALLLCSNESKYTVQRLKNHSRTKWYGGTLSRKLIILSGCRVERLQHVQPDWWFFDEPRETNNVNKHKVAALREMLRSHGKNTTGLKPALVERVVHMWREEVIREAEKQLSILTSFRAMPPTYPLPSVVEWILKVEMMVNRDKAHNWLKRVLEAAAPAHETQREEECVICRNNFNDDNIVQACRCCKLRLHPQCLQKLVNANEPNLDKCPNCRTLFEYE